MAEIDAGVDHRDANREELLGRIEGVECVITAEVPLTRDERVVRQRVAGRGGGPGEHEPEHRNEQRALHACTTVSTGERPSA